MDIRSVTRGDLDINIAGGYSSVLSTGDRYVTFSDFIIQYHKIPHSDLSLINKIEFTMKKRSLVHQICFNVHTHLMKSLLNITDDQT